MRFGAKEEEQCKREWHALVRDIEANLHQDPASELGVAFGKRCMDWVNHLYGKEYLDLRNAIWEKGFKGGHAADEHGLSPSAVEWLDKAIDAYHRNRIYKVLDQVTSLSSQQILKRWEELMDDMYGDNQNERNAVIELALQDAKVSEAAKDWLKKMFK